MSDLTRPNDLSDYVYKGLWINYHAGPFWRWTLTLTDFEALVCLACISILLAFTQSRAWVLFRFAIYQKTKSPRLPDPENVDYRQRLSQGNAVAGFFSQSKRTIKRAFHRIKQKSSVQLDHELCLEADDPVVPSQFGPVALFNIMFFLSMGVAIPWTLTDGSLKTPVVKSKVTKTCLEAKRYEKLPDVFAGFPETDIFFQQCRLRHYDSCVAEAYFRRPNIHKERTRTCPFSGDICRNDTLAIEITHRDIGAYDVGVNSFIKITMNHRLTCAPITLDPFYVFGYDKSTSVEPLNASITILDATLPKLKGKVIYKGYATTLYTLNGPNFASPKNSGLFMARIAGKSSLRILPHPFNSFGSEMQHPSLRTNDSLPFMLLYRAGSTFHTDPSDDPLFSAHNPCVDNVSGLNHTVYCADREVTALGCSEKFQFCLESLGCTDWGQKSDRAYSLLNGSLAQSSEDIRGDILTLYRMMPAMMSVHEYLGLRSAFSRSMLPLVTRDSDAFQTTNNSEPWVTEVENWFVKGTVDAIRFGRYGARFPLDTESENFDENFRRKYSLCGRILFRHGSYTNLSWIGLWITIGTLVLICLGSYHLETIHHCALKWQRITAKIVNLVIFSQRTLGDRTLASRRKIAARCRTAAIWWRKISQLNIRFRRWLSNDSQNTSPAQETELDGVEIRSVVPIIEDGPVNPSLEDIDGVI
jgi:hypothetical protein